MAQMTAAQTATELARKASLGIKPTDPANNAAYTALKTTAMPSTNGINRTPTDGSFGMTSAPKALAGMPTTTKTAPMVGPILPGATRPDVSVTTPNIPPAAGPQSGILQGPYLQYGADGNVSGVNQGFNPATDTISKPPAAVPATPGYDLNGITKTATDSINAQIATQIAAYNQQVASGQQANNLALSQNTNYLTNALKSSGDQHTVDNSNAQTTQNRRGGFYSGGLDYQLGSQDRAYATAEGNLRQDVQARNDDIYSKNALLASQAADNIQRLQSQAPSMIRQAIQDEIDRQRGINIQEAGLTGQYKGKDTMAQNNAKVANNVAVAGLTGEYTPPQTTALQLEMSANSKAYAGASPAVQQQLHARNEEIAKQLGMTYNAGSGTYSGGNGAIRTVAGQKADQDKAETLAKLTGYMSDGKGGYVPTNEKQQQDLTNAWKETEQLGTVSPALSKLTGIKAGTPTQTAKNQAQQIGISQQNATNSKNNMNADNTRQDNAVNQSKDQKTFAGTIAGELAQAKSKEDVVNFFNSNAAEITGKLGIDAATKMKNDALAAYDKVTPVDKQEQSIREKAIAAAQKEYKWTNATAAERATMIKDYEALFN